MDSHLTSESLVGAKLTLSPLRIVSREYTLVWAHDCTFFLAQKTDYTGVRTIICKPIKNRIFRPYVISYWPGVIGVRLTSAFSGEEVCSKLLCGNEFTWTHMMESFRHTFIEMGITYPEIRAIKLQNDANEELNLEHPIEYNEERLHKESEESSDSSIDFWTRWCIYARSLHKNHMVPIVQWCFDRNSLFCVIWLGRSWWQLELNQLDHLDHMSLKCYDALDVQKCGLFDLYWSRLILFSQLQIGNVLHWCLPAR